LDDGVLAWHTPGHPQFRDGDASRVADRQMACPHGAQERHCPTSPEGKVPFDDSSQGSLALMHGFGHPPSSV
jgi:hypothetical protein